MATYNLGVITKKIYDSNLHLFNLKTLQDILEIKKESTLFSIIKKLLIYKVLIKVEKDKYILNNSQSKDFVLANFLYQPSYISFETALNFYGILSQFPYEIISATPKKTIKKTIDDKIYSFNHIKNNLFWGYEKKDNYLIAFPEKALTDQIYFVSKGLKSISPEELNLSLINRKILKDFLNKYPKTRKFVDLVKTVQFYLKK